MTTTAAQGRDEFQNETVFQNTLCERVDAWRELPEYAEITLVDWLLESGILVTTASPSSNGAESAEAAMDRENHWRKLEGRDPVPPQPAPDAMREVEDHCPHCRQTRGDGGCDKCGNGQPVQQRPEILNRVSNAWNITLTEPSDRWDMQPPIDERYTEYVLSDAERAELRAALSNHKDSNS